MKKFAKLSLVAAVAVAGLSTSASAVALEEAIKGVDVSGYVRYRMNNVEDNKKTTEASASSNTNEYKISLGAKIPVNDNVKAKVALSVKGTTDNQDDNANDGDDDTAAGAAKPGVSVKCANFTYTAGKTSVTAGQMAIKTPISGADAYGTGALALSSMGNVTLAAGYFLNSDSTDTLADNMDITAAAAIGSFGPVNAQAWYFNVEDALDSLVFTQVDGKVGPVSVKAQYAVASTDKDLNDAGVSKDGYFTGIEVAAKVANIDLSAGYTTRGDVADSAPVTVEYDASYIGTGENLETEQDAGADTVFVAASTSFGAISAGIEYSDQEISETKTESKETVLRAGYKMSKNFKVSTFYSMLETDVNGANTVDSDHARLEVKYSF
jgi:hypothetical protein